MGQGYKAIVVSVGMEKDIDILNLVERLHREGRQVSPWVKQAIRERLERENLDLPEESKECV